MSGVEGMIDSILHEKHELILPHTDSLEYNANSNL